MPPVERARAQRRDREKTPRIGLAALIFGLLMAVGGLAWIAFDVFSGMRGTTLP